MEIIQDCWHENKEARPTFTNIRRIMHDEIARLQNHMKEPLNCLKEQERSKNVTAVVTVVGSQEDRPKFPDPGILMDNSTAQREGHNLVIIAYILLTFQKTSGECEITVWF